MSLSSQLFSPRQQSGKSPSLFQLSKLAPSSRLLPRILALLLSSPQIQARLVEVSLLFAICSPVYFATQHLSLPHSLLSSFISSSLSFLPNCALPNSQLALIALYSYSYSCTCTTTKHRQSPCSFPTHSTAEMVSHPQMSRTMTETVPLPKVVSPAADSLAVA